MGVNLAARGAEGIDVGEVRVLLANGGEYLLKEDKMAQTRQERSKVSSWR
jgi:hypothetical protein